MSFSRYLYQAIVIHILDRIMSKKFKIELDDDVLKKLKYEDLMLVLGIQKLSESKKYETDKSLIEIGKQSFEETTKANKSNPIVDIIQTKNITKSEKETENVKKEEIDNKTNDSVLEPIEKPSVQPKTAKKDQVSTKNEKQPLVKPDKPELKISFQIISINHDLSIEDNINIAKH